MVKVFWGCWNFLLFFYLYFLLLKLVVRPKLCGKHLYPYVCIDFFPLNPLKWRKFYVFALSIKTNLLFFSQTFQRELSRRKANYESVMKAGRAMLNENKVEEPQALEDKLDDLRMRWDAVIAMSNTKEDRLDNALVLAKEFDSSVKTELRILKQFEDDLRELGPISEDLAGIEEQLEKHKVCPLSRVIYQLLNELTR